MERGSKRDNRVCQWKKSHKEKQGNRVREILLSELQHCQDVTCGEQEEETGQIQINLVAAPENMSIPLGASVAVNVLIKACTFGLFLTLVWCYYSQLTWGKKGSLQILTMDLWVSSYFKFQEYTYWACRMNTFSVFS